MSMYGACRYCGDLVVEPGTVACSNPEHRELAKKSAQLSFNSAPTKENAVLLSKEAGLPEDYFLKQLQMKKVPGLHKEVVMGIIQVIKFLNELMKKDGETSLTELFSIGTKDRREDSHNFILEFIKDGVVNLTKDQIIKVAAGSYDGLWESTNENLRQCGYQPEKPEKIDI